MKYSFLLITGLLLTLAGCDLKTGDDADDHPSSYYFPDYGGYVLERHTLIGSVEVQNAKTGLPLSNLRIEGWVYHDGHVRDSFTLWTNDEGVVRIEITLRDTERPFGRMDIRILEPGFRPLLVSLSIRKTGTIEDDRGLPTTVYETSGVLRMNPL